MCNGQLLPINQNQALFSLLGTTYGGDGRVNFALPNLQERVPVHVGAGITLGERGGEQNHTLTQAEIPGHTHGPLQASATVGATPIPQSNVFARSATAIYAPASGLGAMNPAAVTTVGGSQPHTNMQPYLALNFCVALQGIFPSRN